MFNVSVRAETDDNTKDLVNGMVEGLVFDMELTHIMLTISLSTPTETKSFRLEACFQ